MTRILFTLLLFSIEIVAIAQQKSYITKKIGQWNLEKFPAHYYIEPAKKEYTKNRTSGKLELYEEKNNLGQAEGLTLFMSSDGINPLSATYWRKGIAVYVTSFFSSSSKAQIITNFNLNSELDGYSITRTVKSSGGYDEESEKFDNGVLIERNGIKQTPPSSTYDDSLLNGRFKIEPKENYYTIEGEANRGKLKFIRQSLKGASYLREIIFETDSFSLKKSSDYQAGEFTIEKFPLRNIPIITNSIKKCSDFGNFIGYPYLVFLEDFDVTRFAKSLELFYPEPLPTIQNYQNGLLHGEFQFRQYSLPGGGFDGAYSDVKGLADHGKLKKLTLSNFVLDPYSNTLKSHKVIEYLIEGNTITQNEYVPKVSSIPLATKQIDLQYEVLLTNSEKLGGTYSFYSRNGTNNSFGIPTDRSARLENNEYGYVLFTPLTFDINNFIRIVTTKTIKPVKRNVKMENSLLSGEFEFREDRVEFRGTSSEGVIVDLLTKYDFENTKTIDGKYVIFNTRRYSFNGTSVTIEYYLSGNESAAVKEIFLVSKQRKMTDNSDLKDYPDFLFFDNDSNLRRALLDLEFVEFKR